MPAKITSSKAAPMYSQNSSNMAVKADIDALLSTGRTSNPCELNKALKTRYDDYKQLDHQDWIEKYNTGQQIANLTQGKLVLQRNIRTGQMRLVKPDGRWADNKTVGGKFQFYITNLTAEWLSSRPERDPLCPSDQDQIEEFIADVKIVQDYYDKKFFTTEYEQKEAEEAFGFGTWITRYRFDPEVEDIIRELIPFPASRWDMRVTPEDSEWFIYESKCPASVLEHLLDADVQGDDATENYGLQVMEQITRQGTAVRGEGKDRYGSYELNRDEVTVIEMWLQPSAYCDIELAMPEKTISGEIIPKGRSLLKLFPKGMVIVGINDLNTILSIHAENHKDHIVSGRYHNRQYSGVGKGVEDAVDVYKEYCDLHSQMLLGTKLHATPGTAYNKDMVSEQNARDIGKPRKNIPIDFTNAPDGIKSVHEAIQVITPSNPSQAGFEYLQRLDADLQNAFQVTSFSEGLPGVNNETATGAKIGESLAMKQLLPQHLNKADHRMRSDKVIYNLFRKFVNKPKFFATKTKNGITAGKYLAGDRFEDVDVEFEIVANSETPKTAFAEEQSLSRLFQFTGGMQGLWEMGQQDPDFTSEVVTAFGVKKLPIQKTMDIARVCRKRIEQAKEMLNVELEKQAILERAFGIAPDTTNQAAGIVSRLMPPISPNEPFVQQKVAWLSELLDADEMQYAPMELRYVIEQMMSVHVQATTLGQAQLAQDQNMAAIMANLPQLVGEQAMSRENQMLEQQFAAEQAQQQQAQAQAQAGQQLQLKAMDAEASEKQAEAQYARDRATSEDAHNKAKELKQMELKKAA